MHNPTQGATAPDLIPLIASAEDDREARESLRAILLTHTVLESTTTLRHFFVHLLAAMGGLFVACWLFPAAASQTVRDALFGTWLLCCLAALTTAAVEWRLHADEARLLVRGGRRSRNGR